MMGRFAPRLAVAVGAVCFLAAPLRADFVRYSYSSIPAAPSVTSNSSSSSAVNFNGENNVLAFGNSDIVLAGLTTTSTASPTNPATFTNRFWAVDLEITDYTSGDSYNFLFGGQLNGQLSNASSTFTNTFIGLTSESATIGNNVFTVTLTTFSPPGPPTASNTGSIGAYVSVVQKAGGTIQGDTAPEPSTLVLAGLGLAGFAVARWRRRQAAVEMV
jgi:hypothetical protein